MIGDTLSLKVYQALAAALDMNGTRKIILSDTGNFPTDLYMAEGLIATLGTAWLVQKFLEPRPTTLVQNEFKKVDYEHNARN